MTYSVWSGTLNHTVPLSLCLC